VQPARIVEQAMAKAFQSSPALKDRCNKKNQKISPRALDVSILTGLERPVQPKARKKTIQLGERFNPHRP